MTKKKRDPLDFPHGLLAAVVFLIALTPLWTIIHSPAIWLDPDLYSLVLLFGSMFGIAGAVALTPGFRARRAVGKERLRELKLELARDDIDERIDSALQTFRAIENPSAIKDADTVEKLAGRSLNGSRVVRLYNHLLVADTIGPLLKSAHELKRENAGNEITPAIRLLSGVATEYYKVLQQDPPPYGATRCELVKDASFVLSLAQQIAQFHTTNANTIRNLHRRASGISHDPDSILIKSLESLQDEYPISLEEALADLKVRIVALRAIKETIERVETLDASLNKIRVELVPDDADWPSQPIFAPHSFGDIKAAMGPFSEKVHAWEKLLPSVKSINSKENLLSEITQALPEIYKEQFWQIPQRPDPVMDPAGFIPHLEKYESQLQTYIAATAQALYIENSQEMRAPIPIVEDTVLPPAALITACLQAHQEFTEQLQFKKLEADSQRTSALELAKKLEESRIVSGHLSDLLQDHEPLVSERDLEEAINGQNNRKRWWITVEERLSAYRDVYLPIAKSWKQTALAGAPPHPSPAPLAFTKGEGISPKQLSDAVDHWKSTAHAILSQQEDWLEKHANVKRVLTTLRPDIEPDFLFTTPYSAQEVDTSINEQAHAIKSCLYLLRQLEPAVNRTADTFRHLGRVNRHWDDLEITSTEFFPPPQLPRWDSTLPATSFERYCDSTEEWIDCVSRFQEIAAEWHPLKTRVDDANAEAGHVPLPLFPPLGIPNKEDFSTREAAEDSSSKWQNLLEEAEGLLRSYSRQTEQLLEETKNWTEGPVGPLTENPDHFSATAPTHYLEAAHRCVDTCTLICSRAIEWSDVHALYHKMTEKFTQVDGLITIKIGDDFILKGPPQLQNKQLDQTPAAWIQWKEDSQSSSNLLDQIQAVTSRIGGFLTEARDATSSYPSPPVLPLTGNLAPANLKNLLDNHLAALHDWEKATETWPQTATALERLAQQVENFGPHPQPAVTGHIKPEAYLNEYTKGTANWSGAVDRFRSFADETKALSTTLEEAFAFVDPLSRGVVSLEKHGWPVPEILPLKLDGTPPPLPEVERWRRHLGDWKRHIERLQSLKEAHEALTRRSQEAHQRGHTVIPSIKDLLISNAGPDTAGTPESLATALEHIDAANAFLHAVEELDSEHESVLAFSTGLTNPEEANWYKEISDRPIIQWEAGQALDQAHSSFQKEAEKWRQKSGKVLKAAKLAEEIKGILLNAGYNAEKLPGMEWIPARPAQELEEVAESLAEQRDVYGLELLKRDIGNTQSDYETAVNSAKSSVDLIKKTGESYGGLLEKFPEAFRWRAKRQEIEDLPTTSLPALHSKAGESKALLSDFTAAVQLLESGQTALKNITTIARILHTDNPAGPAGDRLHNMFLDRSLGEMKNALGQIGELHETLLDAESSRIETHRTHATEFQRAMNELADSSLPKSMAEVLRHAGDSVVEVLTLKKSPRDRLLAYIDAVMEAENRLQSVTELFKAELQAFRESAEALPQDQEEDRRTIRLAVDRCVKLLDESNFGQAVALRNEIMDALTRAVFPGEISDSEVFSLAHVIYEKFEVA